MWLEVFLPTFQISYNTNIKTVILRNINFTLLFKLQLPEVYQTKYQRAKLDLNISLIVAIIDVRLC